MAFAVVSSKRASLAVAGLLKTLLLAQPAASASASAAALRPVAARRLFSTDGEQECSGDEGVASDLGRSRGFSFPMSPVTKYVFGVPVCMGRLVGEPAPRGCCGCWVLTEDVDAVKLKVAMPGLGKEHVKVWGEEGAEVDDMVMEAEGVRDPEFDDDYEGPPRYKYHMKFPKNALKWDQIKAEMKHGALKVTVPKIKREDAEESAEDAEESAEESAEDAEESAGLYGTSRKPSWFRS